MTVAEEPAAFTPATYHRRLARVQSALQNAGHERVVLTRQGTLAYLTGVFLPWRSGLILRPGAEPVFVTQDVDAGRVRAETWLPQVRAWTGRPSFVDCVVEALGDGATGEVAVEMGGPMAQGLLLANELRRLQQRLPGVTWTDAVAAVDRVLVRKEPGEVERLERASRMAERGVMAAADALAPGISEIELAGVIEHEARRAGSEWAWSLTGGSEVAVGERTGYPGCVCTPPTARRVERGEFVTLDAHATFEHYQGELCTNAFVGEMSREQRAYADAYARILHALVGALAPGVRIADVCAPAQAIAAEAGLAEHLVPLFGHGLGTDARIPPIVAPWNRATIDEATTLVVLVQLTHPTLGGLRAEYPVVVADDGARPLVETDGEVLVRA